MFLPSALGLLVLTSAVLGAVTQFRPNATSSTPKHHLNGGTLPAKQSQHHSGIHVASWRWDEIGVFFTFTAFVLVTGLAKIGE
jgi:uncharacterized membrane protein YecN with MAPEG domain